MNETAPAPSPSSLPPCVVVHGLAGAASALAPGRPVTLLSAPAAALYAGAGWWRALIEAAREAYQTRVYADILDCGDAPGAAMAALRLGQRWLVLDPACPALQAVLGAARAAGGTVLTHRPPALDLAEPGADRRLAAWLGGGDPTDPA